ncbi:hypothetical protein J0895_22915 [Phormidium pseudopriestleyi FRX01]|uniref:Uncharacterized protein n=1 Tax=Phormidium pseudopriestleyi FRX01 TaxID=1759528 RepID=A0ABS3FXP0_9CYAN|nr:hypothetical protein [Phormidium pseudopriestleyi]MBO0351880.1 hypothetical protein [Phormidium pseudopriestleyi FRX01]
MDQSPGSKSPQLLHLKPPMAIKSPRVVIEVTLKDYTAKTSPPYRIVTPIRSNYGYHLPT